MEKHTANHKCKVNMRHPNEQQASDPCHRGWDAELKTEMKSTPKARTGAPYSLLLLSCAATRSPPIERGATLLCGDVISEGMLSGIRRIERPLFAELAPWRPRSDTLSSSEDLHAQVALHWH